MKSVLLVIAVLVLAACGEREQVAETGKRGYQGKQDARPWDSAPLAYDSAKWTKGDRASWENELKKRQLNQHEDMRIYQ